MEILIADYKLFRKEEGWAISKKYVVGEGKGAGDVHWVDTKYYHRLDFALMRLLDRMLRESPVEEGEVKDLLDALLKAKEEIIEAIASMEEKK